MTPSSPISRCLYWSFLIILAILKEKEFYAKQSKYEFGATSVEYLDHNIGEGMVLINKKKVHALVAWPIPKILN